MGAHSGKMDPEDGLYLLRTVTKILNDHGIDTWLDCGTLLGIVRDRKLIEYDTDVDIATYVENYVEVKKIMKNKKLLEKYGLVVSRSGGDTYNKKLFSIKIKDKPTYLDLYFWEWLPKTGTITFKGGRYLTPKDPEKYLEYLYGTGWRIPKRGKHGGSVNHKWYIRFSDYHRDYHLETKFRKLHY